MRNGPAIAALMVALTMTLLVSASCGGEGETESIRGAETTRGPSETSSAPKVRIDRQDQAIARLRRGQDPEGVCDVYSEDWPVEQDVIYVMNPDGSTEVSCGRP